MSIPPIKTHPESQIVRESIFTALMQLMNVKHFSEISVTDITKRAGVSRMAYYRNYKDKQEILTSHLDSLFDTYWNQIHLMNQSDFQLACLYFGYLRENKLYIKNLIDHGLSQLILDRHDLYLSLIFKELYQNTNLDDVSQKYTISFFSGGLFKLLLDWVQNDMSETDQEMAQIVFTLMNLDHDRLIVLSDKQ